MNKDIKNSGPVERGTARLGFVVPVSNTNLEPDMYSTQPAGTSVHFVRAGGYDLDKVPDSEQMARFADASLEPVLRDLGAARPDVVAYGCTSATLTRGPGYDHAFCGKMHELTGVPCVTAAGALYEALVRLGTNKISFTSPYTRRLNQEGADFLATAGLDVINVAYIGRDLGNYGQSGLKPAEVFELGVSADHPEAECIVLSCTDMRAVETLDALEQHLGKPVISSNQALMHVVAGRLGLRSRVPGTLGRI